MSVNRGGGIAMSQDHLLLNPCPLPIHATSRSREKFHFPGRYVELGTLFSPWKRRFNVPTADGSFIGLAVVNRRKGKRDSKFR